MAGQNSVKFYNIILKIVLFLLGFLHAYGETNGRIHLIRRSVGLLTRQKHYNFLAGRGVSL
jgi:hypothetical protein